MLVKELTRRLTVNLEQLPQSTECCTSKSNISILAMADGLDAGETSRVLEDIFQILKQGKVFDTPGDHPVVNFLHPAELQVNYISIIIFLFQTK